MEKLWLAAGTAGVAALALLRLRRMLRWVRCEATFLGRSGLGRIGVSYTGEPLPIVFTLPGGTPARASLRHFSRGNPPPAGARARIIYDPDDPRRAEWAASVPVLAVLIAVLLAIFAAVLLSWMRDGGMA